MQYTECTSSKHNTHDQQCNICIVYLTLCIAQSTLYILHTIYIIRHCFYCVIQSLHLNMRLITSIHGTAHWTYRQYEVN